MWLKLLPDPLLIQQNISAVNWVRNQNLMKKLGLLLSMVLMIIQNLWLCWRFLLRSMCNAMDVAILRQKSLYQKHK
uniref:Uncharacterized protein n=1 Tax=Picea sitchensis TaxID=3332 RepID=A9P0G1_PICSI|nr:unknown [Picea sitchensis]